MTITINSKKYAKNNNNFVNTLFEKDGTAFGYYKKRKNSVLFYTMGMELFAACVVTPKFKGFVNARELNGKEFFQHSYSEKVKDILGIPDSHLREIEYAEIVFNKFS
jgi:hypothetical protein